MTTLENRNQRLVNQLKTDFFHRNDAYLYMPATISLLQSQIDLRAIWLLNGSSGTDISGNGRHLTYNGTATYNIDGFAPYLDFDGASYLERTDESALDLTGIEAWVAPALRGFTICGWFYPTASGGSPFLFSKDDSGFNKSYSIFLNNDTTVRGRISGDGSTNIDTSAVTTTSILDKWGFYVLRFTPSTEELVRVINADESASGIRTTSVPASIFDGNAPFNIGARNSGSNLFTGRGSLVTLFGSVLSDVMIDLIFEVSRGIYGV